MRALVLALVLAACGQNAPAGDPPTINTTGTVSAAAWDLSGPLIAVGQGFRLDALPDQNTVVLHYIREDLTVSGPYAAPVITGASALLQSNDIALTLTLAPCTFEGVSYPMRASIAITNARPSEGCAFFRWDRDLLALMPQINACIAQSPETRWITYAARSGEEVVVSMQGGQRFAQCIVRGEIASVGTSRGDPLFDGEDEAIFVRGPGENPGGECYDAPEVRSASGELLGWMMDPMGC